MTIGENEENNREKPVCLSKDESKNGSSSGSLISLEEVNKEGEE